MNFFKHLLAFLNNDPDSMRLGAVRERLEEIEYQTPADSRRALRQDMQRIYGDLKSATNQASYHGKESRTK